MKTPTPRPPDPGNQTALLNSIRNTVVTTYSQVEQLQQSVAILAGDVHALKAATAATITDIATLLGPLQAVIGDPAAANEIEVVIKNLNAVAKQLQSGT